jgi:multiple sugar transport system permease protein
VGRRAGIVAGRVGNAVILVAACGLVLVPLAMLVLGSVHPSTQFYNGLSGLTGPTWTTQNFRALFTSATEAWSALQNSLVITGVSTAAAVMIGSLAAYALYRLRRRRWAEGALVGLLAVRFYPKIALIIPYYMFMRALGLLDTRIGVILIYVSIALPFAVLVIETYFRGLPPELLEAAMVDGASELRMFRSIALPIALPALAGSAILVAFVCWNEFLIVSSLTSTQAMTLPVVLSTFITDKGMNLGGISALEVLTVIPMIVLVLTVQRYIVQGMTSGMVKG